MDITAKMVKELRDKTGLGMMDCKKALQECDGDAEKAVEFMRIKGHKVAEKRAGREALQGVIESYIHTGGKIGVLLELNCETDFVARTDDFKGLARDIAMQVAAAAPRWLAPEDVPEDVIEKEKVIFAEAAAGEGKPEKIIPKIIEGKMRRFYEENCLLEQTFIKDSDKKIKDLIIDNVAKIGENVKIGKYARLVLGQ